MQLGLRYPPDNRFESELSNALLLFQEIWLEGNTPYNGVPITFGSIGCTGGVTGQPITLNGFTAALPVNRGGVHCLVLHTIPLGIPLIVLSGSLHVLLLLQRLPFYLSPMGTIRNLPSIDQ